MKAWFISHTSGPEGLQLRETADPVPSGSEVLVAVRTTALNRADILQIRGHYPAPPGAPPDIPGLEYAGEVIATGHDVQSLRKGDRVMGIVGGGAFAEKVVVHERETLPIPGNLSFEEAAAVPEAFITAWDALVSQGSMLPGERVLIHAATSGVGTAGVQIASAIGSKVIATGRTAAKLERLRREIASVDCITVGSNARFADDVNRLTEGEGIDLILDLVGGAYLPESLSTLRSRGRILLVGLLAGSTAQLDLGRILTRRLRVIGTVLRSRPLEEKFAVAQVAKRHVLPLFHSGRLRPVIDSVVPMQDMNGAIRRMVSNDTFGKLVLRW